MLMAGCASSMQANGPGRWAEGPLRANLALGPTAQDTHVATLSTGRALWPATENGYRLDNATYYYRVRYDYETSYNRYGGVHNSAQSIETGVWVR